MEKNKLVEIHKGETGTGLLIENDGFISKDCGNNKALFESFNKLNEDANGNEFHCPYPFIVDAVFQKYGIENANGRIYPENVLKREVAKYQELIKEKRAIGECYTPDAMILTENGWKSLEEVKEGDNILTLNVETNQIEIQPIERKIEYDYEGDMINIKGRNINDLVTPEHGYPIYDRNFKFKKYVTADEIHNEDKLSHYYIPKIGEWSGRNDEYFVIPNLPEERIAKFQKNIREKYSSDLKIPMKTFAKFMGIYLSEGCCDKDVDGDRVSVYQVKESVCEEINNLFIEMGLPYSVNEYSGENGNARKTFYICDMRLCKYLQQFGDCYTKFVPLELKQQNKEILRLFYDWFVMGDGRIRGDQRIDVNLTDDVFSTSKQLVLDLNEIQLKIGYSGHFHMEKRDNDRYIFDRLIEGKNCQPLYFSLRSLTKGIYLDKRFIKTEKVPYKGKVMCVEVKNHTWYVMQNDKCHWTKNCNHPESSVIDLSRVSHNIVELHWEGHTLVGKLEILTSEGFRKNGIISCQGDQIAHLILSGIKIGVSSRGLGSVTQKMGVLYVGDDYEIVCWDVVGDPSTPNAWISDSYEKLTPFIEGKEKSDKPELFEKLSKYNNWLNE